MTCGVSKDCVSPDTFSGFEADPLVIFRILDFEFIPVIFKNIPENLVI